MMTCKSSKLGHTDLVFVSWSEFIIRSACRITGVTVQRLWFLSPWLTHRQLLTSYTI